MKIISPVLSSMRGKLGGAVGAVSRGGQQYLRSLVIPGNPRSIYQTTSRLILTALAAAWRATLTDLQRSVWESISPATSSGIDTYVKSNAQALLAGLARTDAAPNSAALVTTPVNLPVVDASAHTIVFTGAANANTGYNVFISRPQRSSRLAQEFNLTFVALATVVAGTATANIPISHPAYNLVAADIVYVEVVQFGTPATATAGQTAPPQRFRVVVQA